MGRKKQAKVDLLPPHPGLEHLVFGLPMGAPWAAFCRVSGVQRVDCIEIGLATETNDGLLQVKTDALRTLAEGCPRKTK
jgi:hypothetical protein